MPSRTALLHSRLREIAVRPDVWAVVLIATLSSAITFLNLDFPIGFHFDEPNKVSLTQGQRWTYLHPPLLVDLARLIAWLSDAQTNWDFLMAGRVVSALAAIASSVLFYLTLRAYVRAPIALIWSLAFACSPAIAVHGHFLKEDAVLVFTICAGLHAFSLLEKRITSGRLIYFGICLGLAPAAKYIGALHTAFLVAAAIGFFRLQLRQTFLVAACAVSSFVLVFLASVQGPFAEMPALLARGFSYEVEHAARGHDNADWFTAGYGFTHFWHHLRPALTSTTLVICMALTGWAIVRLRDAKVILFAAFALLFLIAIELSPLKIIGSIRYVLPVAVYLMFAAAISAGRLSAAHARLALPIFAVSGIAAASAAIAGVGYVINLTESRDTRASAIRFLTDQGISNFATDFARVFPGARYALYPKLSGYDYYMSIRTERALRGGLLPDQTDSTYRRADFFRCLSAHQIAEFSRYYGDFGAVAPTVYVYDLRGATECR